MCRQQEAVDGVQRQNVVCFQISGSREVQVLILYGIACFVLPRVLLLVESWILFLCIRGELQVHPVRATYGIESRRLIEVSTFIVAGDAEVQTLHVEERLSLAPQLNTFL